MINDKLIDVFLQNAEQEDLIRGIKQILNHLKIENSYNYEEVFNNIVNIIDNTVKIVYKRECNDYNSNDRIKYTDYLKKVKEN